MLEGAEELQQKQLAVMEAIRATGCDAETPSVYADGNGNYICRCMVCGRCAHHTGNSHQGHYWSYCKVTREMEKFHFCCPGACELFDALLPIDTQPPSDDSEGDKIG